MKRLIAIGAIGIFLLSSISQGVEAHKIGKKSYKGRSITNDKLIFLIKNLEANKSFLDAKTDTKTKILLKDNTTEVDFKGDSKASIESLLSFWADADSAMEVLNKCTTKEDPTIESVQKFVKACSEELGLATFAKDPKKLEEKLKESVVLDLASFLACQKGLKEIFDKKAEKFSNKKLAGGEEQLLKSLDTVFEKVFKGSLTEDQLKGDPKEENTLWVDIRDKKKDALKAIEGTKIDDMKLLCKLEVATKDGKEIITDENGKKESDDDKKELNPGDIKPAPAIGTPDKGPGKNDQQQPIPTGTPTPFPTSVIPNPTPFNPPLDPGLGVNNQLNPLDLLGQLLPLLSQFQQTPPPDIRRDGDRSAQGGNRSETQPPQEQLPQFPFPSSDDGQQDQQVPPPIPTPPLVTLPPTANTNSGSSDLAAQLALFDRLNQRPGFTPIPTPTTNPAFDVARAAALAGEQKRQEMLMQLMLNQRQMPQAPMSAGALLGGASPYFRPNGLFARNSSLMSGARNNLSVLTNRSRRTSSTGTSSSQSGIEIRGNLGQTN